MFSKLLTVLVSEDSSADTAGPHPQGGRQLARHLRVAGQVLPEAPLVHVELPAHRTRMVGAASLGWQKLKSVKTELSSRGISTRNA